MENCIKCNKEFKTKDLFLQWFTASSEVFICKDCIEKHKMYQTESCYAADSDITFVFAGAMVYVQERPLKGDFVQLSATLIGYHYGKPDKQCAEAILSDWLTGDDKVRKDLLRQAFNENGKHDEEVLY